VKWGGNAWERRSHSNLTPRSVLSVFEQFLKITSTALKQAFEKSQPVAMTTLVRSVACAASQQGLKCNQTSRCPPL